MQRQSGSCCEPVLGVHAAALVESGGPDDSPDTQSPSMFCGTRRGGMLISSDSRVPQSASDALSDMLQKLSKLSYSFCSRSECLCELVVVAAVAVEFSLDCWQKFAIASLSCDCLRELVVGRQLSSPTGRKRGLQLDARGGIHAAAK